MAIENGYIGYAAGVDPVDLTVSISSNANRILGIIIHARGGQTVSSVTLDPGGNDETATLLTSAQNGTAPGWVYIYYILNPSSGASQTLRVDMTGSAVNVFVHALDMSGMDTTTYQTGYTTATGTSAAPAVTFTTSDDGAHIQATSFSEANSGAAVGTWSGVTGQTTDDATDRGSFQTSAAHAVQTSAGSITADFATTQSDNWISAGVAWLPSTSNSQATIVLNTADLSTFLTATPTLEFTGSDADSDDLTYRIQISNTALFVNGTNQADNNLSTGTGIVHPNPLTSTLTWEGHIQVDDRPGQSFTGGGGILDYVTVYFGSDVDTDGYARVRIYPHSGTYGTSSQPTDAPASSADTPSPGWLATSELYYFDASPGTTPVAHDLYFTGANRILLEDGTYYLVIVDWLPNDELYDNTIRVSSTALVHDGNLWIDGDSVNYGVFATADLRFEIYEEYILLDKYSNAASGFVNTVTGADTDPFNAGEKISFTVQEADKLPAGTYYWRAMVNDPGGLNTWSAFTTERSFTIETYDQMSYLSKVIKQRIFQKMLVR